MTTSIQDFLPGYLVRTRGRERGGQPESQPSANDLLHQEPTRHFVLYRRKDKDIEEWPAESRAGHAFPYRMETGITYQLAGDRDTLFDAQTFHVPKRNKMREFGEHHTRRWAPEAWDKLCAGGSSRC